MSQEVFSYTTCRRDVVQLARTLAWGARGRRFKSCRPDHSSHSMDNLEFNIDAILERNKRVEADKAWETSAFRRMTIGVLTYITAVIFLWIIEAAFPFLSALIPTIAYFLSTITLPPLKRWWIARYFARNTGN